MEELIDEILNGLAPGDWAANKSHIRNVLTRRENANRLNAVLPIWLIPPIGYEIKLLPNAAVQKGKALLMMHPDDYKQSIERKVKS